MGVVCESVWVFFLLLRCLGCKGDPHLVGLYFVCCLDGKPLRNVRLVLEMMYVFTARVCVLQLIVVLVIFLFDKKIEVAN